MNNLKSMSTAKRLILFGFILLLLLTVSYIANNAFYHQKRYRVPKDVETLITGSSLVTNGVDPTYISHSQNIALAAEPLCLSYYKLKSILKEDGSQLKNIVVSYSLVDISYDWDNVFIEQKKISGEMLRRIFCLNLDQDLRVLMDIFPMDYGILSETYIRYKVFPNISDWLLGLNDDFQLGYIGGFNSSSKVLKDDDYKYKKILQDNFPLIKEENKRIVGTMNSYIDSIKYLADKYELKLLTIEFPIVDTLKSAIPNQYKVAYKQHLNEMKLNQSSDWVHFDYGYLDDFYFSDYVHLNRKGADMLSKQLNEEL